MVHSNSPAFGHRTPGTIDLEISNPAILLNEVARRYETVERILMEYVDNALDDAEYLYRENESAYPYPIVIQVVIDTASRSVSITDNCRGMTRDTLQGLVRAIGDSPKRNNPWVNGRFGFGVHAFRAAANSIQFQSKSATSSHHILEFGRDQLYGIREARRSDEPFPGPGPTGTRVVLQEIDREWFVGVCAASVQAEIERHFERLLARSSLQVSVAEEGQPAQLCRPFDYTSQEGVLLQRRLEVCDQDQIFPVEVCLLAGRQAFPNHRPVFNVRGRRVAAFSTMRSFLRRMPGGAALWNHPCLAGYVEAGDLVEPVLNRDNFVRTRRRSLLFGALVGLEPELRKALQDGDSNLEIDPLASLEALVQEALRDAIPDDSRTGFIRIIEELPEAPEARSAWRDGELLICAAHPDFQARLGRPGRTANRIGERLANYLAVLIATDPAEFQSATKLSARIIDLADRLRSAGRK